MKMNMYGAKWVADNVAKIEANEDGVYASIGAYDPDAFKAYLESERVRFVEIALRYQDDPEFQMRNTPKVAYVGEAGADLKEQRTADFHAFLGLDENQNLEVSEVETLWDQMNPVEAAWERRTERTNR